jgi:hypothetical protein
MKVEKTGEAVWKIEGRVIRFGAWRDGLRVVRLGGCEMPVKGPAFLEGTAPEMRPSVWTVATIQFRML